MNDLYIDYDFLMKDIIDAVINMFDYPLDYGELSRYFLDLKYGETSVIDTVMHGSEMYVSIDSKGRIDNIIEKCKMFLTESRNDYEAAKAEQLSEEELEFFKNESLKWEQIIQILSTMKTDKFTIPSLDKYTFVVLPRKKGCSLDDSLYDGTDDIQNTLRNLESMEGLIIASMDSKGMIVTRKRGTGLHKAGDHTMYKNVGNNQRILFKQCENNENVFFVLVVSCNVHGNDQKDDARENQYDDLTSELGKFLDGFREDGRVILSEEDLRRLNDQYQLYKQSLVRRIARDKSDAKLEALNKLVARIVKDVKNKNMNGGDIYG